jgi:hypothetical protein
MRTITEPRTWLAAIAMMLTMSFVVIDSAQAAVTPSPSPGASTSSVADPTLALSEDSDFVVGESVTLNLTVNPADSGEATMWYRMTPSSEWRESSNPDSITVTDGTASFAVKPSASRDYRVTFAGATSNTVSLTAVAPDLTLTGPDTFVLGKRVTLTLDTGTAISGKGTLWYRMTPSSSWQKSSNPVTVTNGTAAFDVKPSATRDYQVKFAGGTSNAVRLTPQEFTVAIEGPPSFVLGELVEVSIDVVPSVTTRGKLWYRMTPTSPWRESGKYVQVNDGNTTVKVKPTATREYRVTVAGSTSNTEILDGIVPTVTLEGPASFELGDPVQFELGDTVPLAVNVSPDATGVVTMWYRITPTSPWRESNKNVYATDGEAAVNVSPTGPRDYRVTFGGVPSNTVSVNPEIESVVLGGSNEFLLGQSAELDVTVSPDLNGVGEVSYRMTPGSGSWVRSTSTTVKVSNGKGSFKVKPSATREYRVKFGDKTSTPMKLSPDILGLVNGVYTPKYHTGGPYPSGMNLESAVSTLTFRKLESVWVIGRVRHDGDPRANALVYLETSSSPHGPWSKSRTTRSSSTGFYEFRMVPTTDRFYRTVTRHSSTGNITARSGVMYSNQVHQNRSLETRRRELRWRLGDDVTGIRTISSSDLSQASVPGNPTSGRWQRYKRGTLVEYTFSGGGKRTWFVEGVVSNRMHNTSGWVGRLGLPLRDAKCVSLESSCVQRFSNGAIYTNSSKKTSVAFGRTSSVEIVAAARSQVGYREPSWRKNKFNTWIDHNHAWCGVFVGWAATASGNSTKVPVEKDWTRFLNAAKNSGVLKNPDNHKMRPGSVVLFNWGSGPAVHTGLVVRVSGNYIYTVEGNTTSGTGSATRGVFERKRSISAVWRFFNPEDF